MGRSRAVYLFSIVVISIGSVEGRWLDRVDDTNTTSVPLGSISGKKCKSIYGFLPCADTLLESIFLMVMYTQVLMLADEWLSKGSEALLIRFKKKKVAGSVFRVLKALPRIVVLIVPGALSSRTNARNQVDFGVAMYAGTTVLTLTGIWGVKVILHTQELCETKSSDENLSPYKSSDYGVNIEKETSIMAFIMILSLIPFANVLLVQVFTGGMMISFALLISALSFSFYVAYQIFSPWIQERSVKYSMQDMIQKVFLENLQGYTYMSLYIDGKPNMAALESIYHKAVGDNHSTQLITRKELEEFIGKDIKDEIIRDYAVEEIKKHFEKDGIEGISMDEFKEGCRAWLINWKGSKNGLSTLEYVYKKLLVDNKIVNDTGEIDEKRIEELFRDFDENNDGRITKEELEKRIKSMNLGKLDPRTLAESIHSDLDQDKSGGISPLEFRTGFKKRLIKETKEHINSDMDKLRKQIHDSFHDAWNIPNTKKEWKRSVLYVVSGALIIYVFVKPFLQSVTQFASELKIPYPFTSFVMAPLFLKARSIVVFAFSLSNRVNSKKDGSLAFFELYSGLVMDNLMGLTSLLTIVYIKDLRWDYMPEVITIIAISLIVGTFASTHKSKPYPLLTSILSFFLYVTTTIAFCLYVWRRA